MFWNDLLLVLRWCLVWSALGWIVWPLAQRFFSEWEDRGYLFAKILGAAGVSFGVLVLSVCKILPFGTEAFIVSSLVLLGVGWMVNRGAKRSGYLRMNWKKIIAEEFLFLFLVCGWAYVKGHEPTINGLEKFMDFGITNSILHSKYMPPADMWYSGETVNYYYFGHFILAVFTQLSGLELGVTFNLMLATLFSLCFCFSFCIARRMGVKLLAAIFVAYLVSLGGNLHTVYSYTSGYSGQEDNPIPFWQILINPFETTTRVNSWNSYWYPNATRFIPYTIHEFPSYSFVVSDIHGHVLDIPLALVSIGFLIDRFFIQKRKPTLIETTFFGWLCGVMFMTNALDGPIYLVSFLLLFGLMVFFDRGRSIRELIFAILFLVTAFLITTWPFTAHFHSFVSGLAINCPPTSLANHKIGPLLFEGVEKCQHSPLWMMFVLWGFFFYCCVALLFLIRNFDKQRAMIFGMFLFICTGLIFFSEFFYFKDIYPQHFRSNTMFKLGYQAFMLLGIWSGYAVVKLISFRSVKRVLFTIGLLPLLYLVVIYPIFSVKSYFGVLNWSNYKGLYGLNWLQEKYPDNFEVISWLKTQNTTMPVSILEASGDSYTDFNQISTFSGSPTVAGWLVHEWLWRGGYEPIAARVEHVRQIYEATDSNMALALLRQYRVKYLVVGDLERQKYPLMQDIVMKQLGEQVFWRPSVTVYQVK